MSGGSLAARQSVRGVGVAERVFVDTNVLLYAHDRDAGEKHAIAEQVLRLLWQGKNGVLSTQVLQEFYLCFTKALDTPAARRSARELIEVYSVWPVTVLDAADVLAACDHADRYHVGVWDAMILVAARKSHADVLLSENPYHGWHISGLEIRNPFI
jgi:predicted nucleic acid-binding protein